MTEAACNFFWLVGGTRHVERCAQEQMAAVSSPSRVGSWHEAISSGHSSVLGNKNTVVAHDSTLTGN